MTVTSEGLPILEGIKVGDSIDFIGTLVDMDGIPVDATGWYIRAEIYNNNNSIKKGSIDVIGGDTTQAKWTDSINGQFQISFANNETNIFTTDATIEIEVDTSIGRRFTVYQGEIKFDSSRISWDDIT